MSSDISSNTANPRTIVNSCGVLVDGAGRILFVHRRPDRDRWPDLWYIPGGEAEDDEDVDATLVRELREELGIEVQTFEFLDTIFDQEPQSGRRAVHNIYAVHTYDGTPALTAPEEHDALEWLALDQLEAHGVPASLQAVLAGRVCHRWRCSTQTSLARAGKIPVGRPRDAGSCRVCHVPPLWRWYSQRWGCPGSTANRCREPWPSTRRYSAVAAASTASGTTAWSRPAALYRLTRRFT